MQQAPGLFLTASAARARELLDLEISRTAKKSQGQVASALLQDLSAQPPTPVSVSFYSLLDQNLRRAPVRTY